MLPKKFSTIAFAITALLLAAVFCFYNLGETSVSPDSDEIIHIRVTQEMFRSGNLWQPTHGGEPYYNKPPFKMWLTLPLLQLLGESNFSYRALDAFFGLGLMLLLLLSARRLLNSYAIGAVSVFVMLGCGTLMLGRHGLRVATQDSLLVFLSTLAMLAAWEIFSALDKQPLERRSIHRWALVFGFAIGLAVLTKTAAGYIPAITAAVFLLFCGRFRLIVKDLRLILLLVLPAIVLPALYFLPHCIWSEDACGKFFLTEVYHRAVQGYHNKSDTWYYLRQLFVRHSIASPLLLGAALIFGLTQEVLQKNKRFLFLLIWAVLPVLLYSVIRSRLAWYIAPAFPAMGLLVGAIVVFAAEKVLFFLKEKSAIKLLGATACVIFLAWGAYHICQNAVSVGSKIVLSKGKRLTLDRVTSDILSYSESHPGKSGVVFLGDVIDARATPKPGRFNVEGIYRGMLSSLITQTENNKEAIALINKEENTFLFSTVDALPEVLTLGPPAAYAVIPPYRLRRFSAAALAYAEEFPAAGFKPRKQIIDFGGSEIPALYGFGPAERAGEISVQYALGPRAALKLKGDAVLKRYGAALGLNMGYSAQGRKEALIVEVYLNEQQLTELKPKRNQFDSVAFKVKPGIWETGDNVLKFRARFENGRAPKKNERVFGFNWLTIKAFPDISPLEAGSPHKPQE